ncbi:MAG: DUF1385 domain-containing protein [Lachnospiraceae bacterium]|nr:DUF1385 domain-containing protein [Lachnospiraceae bacterium]
MKYSGIGGQAVLEGVMMRNKEDYAVAVRKSDGSIEVLKAEYKGIVGNEKVYKIPILRGMLSFIDSLVLGMKALNYSSDLYMEETEESASQVTEEKASQMTEEKASQAAEEKIPKKEEKDSQGVLTVIVTIVAVMLALGLFMVLPYFLSLLFKGFITNDYLLALVEGIIRLLIFVAYIKLISRMEDIRRVFMYHGAEHKCINCIESGMDLTVDNAEKASREHRRCGTSFLLYVMVISILFFALINVPNRVMKVLLRLALIPVIAGVAYEFIRLAGRSTNPVIQALSVPGLWMQKLTTSEPDRAMLEVAIRSVEEVFDWKQYLEENFRSGKKE